jgi:hypothetical protein
MPRARSRLSDGEGLLRAISGVVIYLWVPLYRLGPERLGAPHDGVMVGIMAGERVPRNHPLVKQYPKSFEI